MINEETQQIHRRLGNIELRLDVLEHNSQDLQCGENVIINGHNLRCVLAVGGHGDLHVAMAREPSRALPDGSRFCWRFDVELCSVCGEKGFHRDCYMG